MAEATKPSKVLGFYSAAELARVVGVTPALVRRYALAGILGEGSEGRFGFSDVVLLRTIDALRSARISSTRIRPALSRLKTELPDGVPVSAASVAAVGGRIVARHGEEAWDLESGQRVLDLVRPLSAGDGATATSTGFQELDESVGDRVEEWFELALASEDDDPEQATRLYRRILALDIDHPDAHLNLGRLLHERGDLYLAERHYRRTIAVRDDDATAWFNLGVVLEDRGHKEPAVEAYRRATKLDAHNADAFFNLGNLYEELGESGDAVRCLKRYRQLTRS